MKDYSKEKAGASRSSGTDAAANDSFAYDQSEIKPEAGADPWTECAEEKTLAMFQTFRGEDETVAMTGAGQRSKFAAEDETVAMTGAGAQKQFAPEDETIPIVRRSVEENPKKLPKWIFPAVAAVLVFVLVFAVVHKQNQNQNIYGEGFVFKQGADIDYPPFTYTDDSGKPAGYDVNLAKAVCDYYGWQYEYCPYNYDELDSYLYGGYITCIWSAKEYNEILEDEFIFSDIYMTEADGTQYAVQFQKSDEELCGLVNDALRALKADGTVDKILQKYPELSGVTTGPE